MATNILLDSGAARFPANPTTDPTGVAGDMQYRTDLGRFRIYNGVSWQSIATDTTIGTGFIQSQFASPQAAQFWVANNSRLDAGLILGGTPTGASDVNVITVKDTTSTIAMIASNVTSLTSATGPYYGIRGNTYTAQAGQRGMAFFSSGTPTTPTGNEGCILFFTQDVARLRVDFAGPVNVLNALNVTGVASIVNGTGFSSILCSATTTGETLRIRNTVATGSSLISFYDNTNASKLFVGYGNASFVSTNLQNKGYFYTVGNNIAFSTNNFLTTSLELDSINNTIINGGIMMPGVQIYTTGATVLMNDNIRALYINPASLVSPLQITLPANPRDGQEILVSFGGTITSGTVVTELSIVGSLAATVLKGSSITTAQAGDGYMFKYELTGNRWRIF